MKRYGPYFHKATGYNYFVDIAANGRRKMVYVHRDVVSRREGKVLRSDEIVHHDNENKIDNAEENLELTTPSEHGRLHVRPPELVNLVCAVCKTPFVRLARWERANRKGKAGPFCGKTCAGYREITHGTTSGYSYFGCRCRPCKDAIAEAARRYRRRKNVPAGGSGPGAPNLG